MALGLAWTVLGTACQRGEGSAGPGAFQDVTLTDQNGEPVTSATLANHTLLVSFFFTSCSSVCPKQTRALAEVRAALPLPVRDRVRFVSISVDPENDTPRALLQFARAHQADDRGWSFVRSDAAGTRLVTSRLAAFEAGAAVSPSSHGTSLYLFDRGGRLVQRYRGAPLDVSHLARELVQLDDLKPSGARLASN